MLRHSRCLIELRVRIFDIFHNDNSNIVCMFEMIMCLSVFMSFELCYNTACGHLEAGAYAEALEMLDRAESTYF